MKRNSFLKLFKSTEPLSTWALNKCYYALLPSEKWKQNCPSEIQMKYSNGSSAISSTIASMMSTKSPTWKNCFHFCPFHMIFTIFDHWNIWNYLSYNNCVKKLSKPPLKMRNSLFFVLVSFLLLIYWLNEKISSENAYLHYFWSQIYNHVSEGPKLLNFLFMPEKKLV